MIEIINSIFSAFARNASRILGTPWSFSLAVMSILVWAITGPLFHFNDSWQLAINTSTTIITFLMVFLIQNTQNRDSEAIHLKLDEIIRGMSDADNSILDVESLTEKELLLLLKHYQALAKEKKGDSSAQK